MTDDVNNYLFLVVFYFQGAYGGDEIDVGMGSKGIGVLGSGQIDIHAKQYFPTWTRLAASAKVGDSVIWLQDSVNWEVRSP